MQNKTVARTIDILDLLAISQGPLKLTEISLLLSAPKTSVFEIMQTLVEKGIVEIDNKELKNFKLGLKAFRIGSSVVTKTDLYRVASPIIDKLSLEISETVYLAIEDKGKIVYLSKAESDSPIRSTCNIGTTNAMHLTGLGKALLAMYSNERVYEITGGDKLLLMTPYTLKTSALLMADLELTRARGYAVDNRESDEFLRCVAVPVLNHKNEPVAAISGAVLFSKLPDDRIPELADKMTEAALEISHRLGYMGNTLFMILPSDNVCK